MPSYHAASLQGGLAAPAATMVQLGTPVFSSFRQADGTLAQVCRQWNNAQCKELVPGICCNHQLHICSVCTSVAHHKKICPYFTRPRHPGLDEI